MVIEFCTFGRDSRVVYECVSCCYRGAELINTNLIRRVEQQKIHEQEVLINIKTKMERIKLRQERLNKNHDNLLEHWDGTCCRHHRLA